MTLIRKVNGYKFSKNYRKLYDLAKTQSLICVVDHYDFRDVCHTIYFSDKGFIQVVARGISYIFANDYKEFEFYCNKLNLEWIEPTLVLDGHFKF